jgi:protein TonB
MVPAQPKAKLASLFSVEDYPSEAFRNRHEGTVGFRLQVGADGRVKDCAIMSSSGFASLDSTTCRLLTLRARFSPALDRLGRPTTDSAVGQINWRLGWQRLPR